MALAKKSRLVDAKDFEAVRAKGRRWVHPILVLYALPNGLKHTRMGFAVSKKLGKAVVRNKAKRRLAEAVRVYYPKIASGWDLVLIARSAVTNVTFQEICRVLYNLLGRAKMIDSGDALPTQNQIASRDSKRDGAAARG